MKNAVFFIAFSLFALPLFAMQPEQLPKSEIEKALAAARAERQQMGVPQSYLARLPYELLGQVQGMAELDQFLMNLKDKPWEKYLTRSVLDYLNGRRISDLSEQEKLDFLKFFYKDSYWNKDRLNEALALPSFRSIAKDVNAMGQLIKTDLDPFDLAANLTNSPGALEWMKIADPEIKKWAAYSYRQYLERTHPNPDPVVVQRYKDSGALGRIRVAQPEGGAREN